MSLMQRGTLVAVAAAAHVIGLWPTWWARDFVLQAFDTPPYEGVWILVPHLFLYTTLQALFCLAAWTVLARLQWMPALRLSPRLPTLGWGLAAGFVSIAILAAFFFATGQADAFHEPRINPWIATANIFSNFYEEYVFRGFILVALTAALGFWPAAALSSLAFAATHSISARTSSLDRRDSVALGMDSQAKRRSPRALHRTHDPRLAGRSYTLIVSRG